MDAAEIAGKDSYLKSLGNIARKSAFIFGKLELPKTDEQDFNVSVLARNGGIFQRVRFRRVEGVWTKAERIERNQAVIREEIDSKYPRNAEGKVDWKN